MVALASGKLVKARSIILLYRFIRISRVLSRLKSLSNAQSAISRPRLVA